MAEFCFPWLLEGVCERADRKTQHGRRDSVDVLKMLGEGRVALRGSQEVLQGRLVFHKDGSSHMRRESLGDRPVHMGSMPRHSLKARPSSSRRYIF